MQLKVIRKSNIYSMIVENSILLQTPLHIKNLKVMVIFKNNKFVCVFVGEYFDSKEK